MPQWHSAPSTHPLTLGRCHSQEPWATSACDSWSKPPFPSSFCSACSLWPWEDFWCIAKEVTCFWWVSLLLPPTFLCNIRGALWSSLEIYFADLKNIGTVYFLTKKKNTINQTKTKGWMWTCNSRKTQLNLLLLIGSETHGTGTWTAKLFCRVHL